MIDKETFNKIIMDRVEVLKKRYGFSNQTPYTKLLLNTLAINLLDEIENYNEDAIYPFDKDTLEALKTKNYVGFALCYASLDIDRELESSVNFDVVLANIKCYRDVSAILKTRKKEKPLLIENSDKYHLKEYLTNVWNLVYCEAWKQLLAPLQNYLLD